MLLGELADINLLEEKGSSTGSSSSSSSSVMRSVYGTAGVGGGSYLSDPVRI